MPRVVRLLLLSGLIGAALLGAAGPARAQTYAVWSDAPLADALYEFADRTGVELVFALRLVRDLRVSGRYALTDDPEHALGLLLRGTGLRAERIRAGQYVVIAEPLNVTIGGEDEPEAYTGTLEGRVVDAATGAPLWGAHVWLVDLGLGAVVEADGTYAVPDLPTGRYAVRFSYVGYRPVRLDLDVFPDSPRLPPTIRLQQEPIASTQAVVEVGPEDPGLAPGAVDLAARQAAAIPYSLSDGDLAGTLSWLPGLSRTGGGSGALVVRGADPHQTRTLRDGVPLYEPWHAFGLLSAFQPEALRRVRFHRGALPASLGGALAAVLDVESTDALAGDSTGLVDLGPLAARAVADVRLGARAGLHVSARRSTLGLLLAPTLRARGSALVLDPVAARVSDAGPHPGVSFGDVEGKMSVRLRSRVRLDLAGSVGQDAVALRPHAADSLDYLWATHSLSARFRALYGSRTLVEVLAYRSGHAADEQQQGVAAVRWQQELVETGATASVERFLSTAHTVAGGMAVARRHVTGETADADPGAQVQVDEVVGTEIAAFLTDTWSPSRAWTVQPGVRVEGVAGEGSLSHLSISPRLFARWTLRPDALVVRVGLSRQTQAVHRLRARSAEGFDLVASRWVLASRRVPLASAWQAGAGTEWAPSEWLALSVDAYGRWSDGLLEPAAPAAAVPGVDLDALLRLFAPHDGRALGVEVAARSFRGPWTVGLTAALARSEVRRALAGEGWRASRYDRPVMVGLLAERRTERLALAARVDLESGLVRAAGGRAPLEARAGVAAGTSVAWRGVEWGARVQATLRLTPRPADVAGPSTAPPLLGTDSGGIAALPLVSLSARW
jgi:hypothetical protein